MKNALVFFILSIILVVYVSACSPNKNYQEKVGEVMNKWDDAAKVADSTSRIALSAPVTRLQEIKREAESLMVPQKYKACHPHLLNYMNNLIEGYLSFMRNEESIVEQFFIKGYSELRECSSCFPKIVEARLGKQSQDQSVVKTDLNPLIEQCYGQNKDVASKILGKPINERIEQFGIYRMYNVNGVIFSLFFDKDDICTGSTYSIPEKKVTTKPDVHSSSSKGPSREHFNMVDTYLDSARSIFADAIRNSKYILASRRYRRLSQYEVLEVQKQFDEAFQHFEMATEEARKSLTQEILQGEETEYLSRLIEQIREEKYKVTNYKAKFNSNLDNQQVYY